MNGPDDLRAGANRPPWQRRLFHAVAGSFVPLAAIFLAEPYPVILAGILALGSLALDLARFRIAWLNRIFLDKLRVLLKSSEDSRLTGATFLLIAACLSFLLFEKEVAIAVLLFLSLGDPVAALVGQSVPGPRIFGKSPVGTLAFILASLAVVGALTAGGIADFRWMFLAGAVVAGLVELAPLPLDDNLTVPIIAGAVIQYLPLLVDVLSP